MTDKRENTKNNKQKQKTLDKRGADVRGAGGGLPEVIGSVGGSFASAKDRTLEPFQLVDTMNGGKRRGKGAWKGAWKGLLYQRSKR